MTNRVQTLRSSVTGNIPAPATRAAGELWANFADKQLGVIDAARTAQKLLAVRYFTTTAAYVTGDVVVQAGELYIAKSSIAAGAFNATQWNQVAWISDILAPYVLPTASTTTLGGVKIDGSTININGAGVISSAGLVTVQSTAPSPVQNGALWYDLVGGQLYVWANDGSSSQWVVAVNQSLGGVYLPLGGGTLTGDLILNRDPVVALGAATKAYADTKAAASSLANYLPLTGGTLTGNLNGTSASFSGGTSSADVRIIATTSGGSPTLHLVDADNSTVRGLVYWSAANGVLLQNISPNFYISLDQTGAFNCSVGTTNKPGGGAWQATSDARIKNVMGEYEQGLNEIIQLRPITYTYKGNDAAEGAPSLHEQAAEDNTPFVGLIAQEVEAIFPEMVSRCEGWIDGVKVDDLRNLDTTPLIFALVNAVKTLKAELDALKAGAR